ncbi:MAG: hypothetical protein VZQ55_06085 [Ruminococcus sp.]|nr:hypothetical protein [Ruminococcus sp.]
MKKIISILLLFSIVICMSACSSKPEEKKLSESDKKYINTVYKYMKAWDVKVSDSGSTWNIDKVAFYDFDGSGKMCFYVLYPITDLYGWGYYINEDGTMEDIDPDVYETDIKTINSGWRARTRAEGTDWDSSATKKQKKNILRKAYKYFLKHNIYDD